MKHRTFTMTRPRRASGFSIVEVLVALIVLAIGLLGLAALQAQGLRFNHDALIRTQATNLAYDIVDRMRTNRDNLDAYTEDDPDEDCEPTEASVEMDLSCWYDSLRLALPGGDGSISANAEDNFFDVAVRWIDRTPRSFNGNVHAPATQAECDSITSRFWDGTNNSCMVQHIWTVFP